MRYGNAANYQAKSGMCFYIHLRLTSTEIDAAVMKVVWVEYTGSEDNEVINVRSFAYGRCNKSL